MQKCVHGCDVCSSFLSVNSVENPEHFLFSLFLFCFFKRHFVSEVGHVRFNCSQSCVCVVSIELKCPFDVEVSSQFSALVEGGTCFCACSPRATRDFYMCSCIPECARMWICSVPFILGRCMITLRFCLALSYGSSDLDMEVKCYGWNHYQGSYGLGGSSDVRRKWSAVFKV